MKETLRDKLLSEINTIDERVKQLGKYIEEYKKDNNYEDAMKCDIMKRQFVLVSNNLKNIL